MHPAYSVILFTTLSGAGYGLLIWLAVLALFGAVPAKPLLGLVGFGLAFALITAGLLASTAHLGRPERAWRAFSQWRTSWLSREGVAAVATYVPAGLLAIGWALLGTHDHVFALCAALSIAGAVATVVCTGMIYQSLPTIRAWHQPLVTPVYVALSLASGGVIVVFLLRVFSQPQGTATIAVVALLGLALILKLVYWRMIDAAPRTWTAGAATGLGGLGTVRALDPPHSRANYVMREMGFSVARKHAEKLRAIATAGLAVPALLTLVSIDAPQTLATVLAGLAVVAMAVGVLVERWLFFAEAQHVVVVFYGAERA